MADLPHYPGTTGDAGAPPERGSASTKLRRVKMLGRVVAILLVLAAIIIHIVLIGGLGRHIP